MTVEEELYLIKTALTLIRAAGGVGIRETTLLETVRGIDGELLDAEHRAALWKTLTERGWITWHTEPVLHVRRWTITDAGLTSLESL